jgi:ubiquinone biosynthesis monooxygenase Coq7
MNARHYNLLDRLLIEAGRVLNGSALNGGALGSSLLAQPQARTASPSQDVAEGELNEAERIHAGGLMRVNHVGEVCAQALYYGQAAVARDTTTREQLLAAAAEETDHLAWCGERLGELGTHPSLLNPLWYAGSYAIGVIAGLRGDGWNLGFVAETERQVEAHLGEHLQTLPANDSRSRAIVQVMKADEARHAERADAAGARKLPTPVAQVMRAASLLMKTIAYRI